MDTHPSDEAGGGPAPAMELPSVWGISPGLPVPDQDLQVLCWSDDSPLFHGGSGAAPRQCAFQDGPARQESQEGGGKVSGKKMPVSDK